MTLRDLSQVYWLKLEIADDRKRLKYLRMKAYSASTSAITGMPTVHGGTSPVEKKAIAVSDAEHALADKIARRDAEYGKLIRFIDGIQDSVTRRIYSLRFIDGRSWARIASEMGMTVSGVKNICYRYLNDYNRRVHE